MKPTHYKTEEFDRIDVAVDAVVLGLKERQLWALLIQRKLEPFKNEWAIPGGFMTKAESAEDTLRRKLLEETGLTDIYFEQLYTFTHPDRDPRKRVISIAYYALVTAENIGIEETDHARIIKWLPIENIPKLSFDHNAILNKAIERLKGKIRYAPIGFELLPTEFTLTQLQQMYEAILQRKLDKRNFRKIMARTKLLTGLQKKEENVGRKPAQLFKFNRAKYNELTKQGFNFEV